LGNIYSDGVDHVLGTTFLEGDDLFDLFLFLLFDGGDFRFGLFVVVLIFGFGLVGRRLLSEGGCELRGKWGGGHGLVELGGGGSGGSGLRFRGLRRRRRFLFNLLLYLLLRLLLRFSLLLLHRSQKVVRDLLLNLFDYGRKKTLGVGILKQKLNIIDGQRHDPHP